MLVRNTCQVDQVDRFHPSLLYRRVLWLNETKKAATHPGHFFEGPSDGRRPFEAAILVLISREARVAVHVSR
jgi:hypothetical protein